MSKDSILLKKAREFSVLVIKFYTKNYKTTPVLSVYRQFLSSGTSIAANLEEAIGAASRPDFINKVRISYKEARETKYWINLLQEISTNDELLQLEALLNEILKMLSATLLKLKK